MAGGGLEHVGCGASLTLINSQHISEARGAVKAHEVLLTRSKGFQHEVVVARIHALRRVAPAQRVQCLLSAHGGVGHLISVEVGEEVAAPAIVQLEVMLHFVGIWDTGRVVRLAVHRYRASSDEAVVREGLRVGLCLVQVVDVVLLPTRAVARDSVVPGNAIVWEIARRMTWSGDDRSALASRTILTLSDPVNCRRQDDDLEIGLCLVLLLVPDEITN